MEGYKVETVTVTFPRYIFVTMFERGYFSAKNPGAGLGWPPKCYL